MASSGDTTIDFTTPGNKSKGRILHDNLFSIILLYVNSVGLPTLYIGGASLTVNTINTNKIKSDMLYIEGADGNGFTALFNNN